MRPLSKDGSTKIGVRDRLYLDLYLNLTSDP